MPGRIMPGRIMPGRVNRELSGRLARLGSAVGRRPWYLQVIICFGLARIFSFCVFVAVAAHQGVSPWGPAQPDYLHFIGIWDSAWYERIYAGGYPDQIPRSPDGTAEENQWAFYALFPALVRALHALTGLDWLVLAPIVATMAGFAAALLCYRLFRQVSGHRSAIWGTAFFAAFPVSAILEVPYAESLNLMLLAAALLLLSRRRYMAAIPVVILMSLSRPTGPPFAVLVALLLLYRFVRRREDRFDLRERLRLLALLAAAALAAVAWPVLAWAVTGEPGAYTDTETAWRGGSLVLFEPWLAAGRSLFGPVFGSAAAALVVVLFVLGMSSAPVRALGVEMRVWCYCYMGYLFAFLHPQTSTFRMLLPLFPLALAATLASRSRAYRGSVLLMFSLLQIVWVAWLWRWAELPGGGDYPP